MTTTETPALFDAEDLIEWVVEVDEILLNSTGAQDRRAMEWWSVHSGLPGIAARITYLAITPPGALLYVACDDQEDDDPRPSRIYCPECGLEKPAAEWRRFGRDYLRAQAS